MLGYDYQIWRSVEAWLRLGDREVLYLECAEDYDVIDEFGAQTVQIKNSPADISLGSKDVRAAITNFWLLRARNPDRGSLSLSFLTRGGACFEQSRPFGLEKGIEFWKMAAAGDDAAAIAIGRFLAASITEQSLKVFLTAASGSELREQLIAPIKWLTSQPNIEAVKLSVERLTIRMCRDHKIAATASTAAVNSFLARCREAVRQTTPESRSLTREDLQLAFENSTSVRVPMQSDLLARIGESLFAGPDGAGDFQHVVFSSTLLESSAPPLPAPVLPREEVVATVLSAVRERNIVLIAGSEGRGKTTIANLAARLFGGHRRWVDLSGLDESKIKSIVEGLLVEIRGSKERQLIVLDDVPVGSDLTQPVWTRLLYLAGECKMQSHGLLLTAKGIHPEAVDSRIRSAQIDIVPVPDLSLTEIEKFFASLGCDDEDAQTLWGHFTLEQTGGGHPKLVYLRGLELRDQGWVLPTSESPLSPPQSIGEAKMVARQAAARTLPEKTCEFLYGLSLALTPVSREVALRVGSSVAGLPAPGDALDSLLGRWIESQGPKGYRVTPLLAGQAALAWPREKVTLAHGCLFDALTQNRELRSDEALPVLSHAFSSGDSRRLESILTTMAVRPIHSEADVYENLEPILDWWRRSTYPVSAFGHSCSVLWKVLVFRVAQQQDPAICGAVADEWSREIACLPKGKIRQISTLLRAFMIASAVEGSSINAVESVQALETLASSDFSVPETAIDSTTPSSSGLRPNLDDDWITNLFGLLLIRCDSIDFQSDMLTALQTVNVSARNRMLSAFTLPSLPDHDLLINRGWAAEAAHHNPRWNFVSDTLRRAITLGAEWNCQGLSISAALALSSVLDTYLEQPDEALACLRNASDLLGLSGRLRSHEAGLLFIRGRYEDALELWENCLTKPAASDLDEISNPFVFVKAGVAAAKLNRHWQASGWFGQAAALAGRVGLNAIAAGAYFDAAYCAFKERSWVRLVNFAACGLNLLRNGSNPQEEKRLQLVRELSGQVLLWILSELMVPADDPIREPPAGLCSTPKDLEDVILGAPKPLDFYCETLVEIASLLDVSTPEIRDIRAQIELTAVPAVAMDYWLFQCNEAMSSGRDLDLAKTLLRVQQAQWFIAAQRRTGLDETQFFHGDVLEGDRQAGIGAHGIFVLAMSIHAISTGSTEEVAAAWAADLDAKADAHLLRDELRHAFEILNSKPAHAELILGSAKSTSWQKLGAAARLLVEPRREATELGILQIMLLFWATKSTARSILGGSLNALARSCISQWQPLLLQNSSLSWPESAVNLLREAVEGKTNEAARLLTLIRAINVGAGIDLPPGLLDIFSKAAIAEEMRSA
ncbi:hypothetical protein [Burkholderia anthina]|uniref:hypothetical protein n=1 Tax=Burkholderia anthina TaxID=179879 RepID=UPI00158AC474|nr:hypothetical protein [Burkholderia anthina]